MSLKAKIEAVIYASEEPVTLAQLVGLLGQEAQTELDRIDAAQHPLPLEQQEEGSVDEEALNEEVLEGAAGPDEAEAEEGRIEAFEEALHEAAAEEAHETVMRAHRAAADDAAMSSGDVPEVAPVAEEPAQKESAGAEEAIDEKQAMREEKARSARLREYFRSLLDQLTSEYATSERGLEIREVAGGYRMATKPEYHDAVRGFVKSLKPPLKLSLQALETLAVVAYKQPVTAPEVSEIRGVDSGGVLGSLMSRKLVTTAGRKQVIGRPILYKTTKEFLVRFGLKDIGELPSIEEFEKMAGELAEQEEMAMPEHESIPNEEEKDVVEPQADGDSGENPADEEIVDGRLSGLPPNYEVNQLPEDEGDSPALDAAIQRDLEEQAKEGE